MLTASLFLSLVWPSQPIQPLQTPIPRQLRMERLQAGYGAHYHDGTMERVARNRGMSQESCMIAVPEPGHLGEWVTVWSLSTGAVERCRVTDYAHPNDRASIERRGIVAEFGLGAARRMCRGLTSYGDMAPWECPIILDWRKP